MTALDAGRLLAQGGFAPVPGVREVDHELKFGWAPEKPERFSQSGV
jgi:hypothetical protein